MDVVGKCNHRRVITAVVPAVTINEDGTTPSPWAVNPSLHGNIGTGFSNISDSRLIPMTEVFQVDPALMNIFFKHNRIRC